MPLKLFQFDISQFYNELISDNYEHSLNIPLKSFPFDTFQFSNAFISNNNEHL